MNEPVTQIKDIDALRMFIELQKANKRKSDFFDKKFQKRLKKK